nr:TIGR02206 family membrane protein [Lysinibacillus timonensis]
MLDLLFSSSPTENPFLVFSLEHLISICLFILGIFLLYAFRNQLNELMTRVVFVAIMLVLEMVYHIWLIFHDLWDASHALPLQLCSVSLILCILLLLTNNKWIFEIVFFIGIAGAIQAILTPELFYNFPHMRYLHFFINHSLIIWTCLFYVWTKGFTITFISIFKSLIFLQIVAFIAFLTNIVTGGNYMFLARKPLSSSTLDYLGDYPWYIFSLEGVAILLFFILYLPFLSKNRSTNKEKV